MSNILNKCNVDVLHLFFSTFKSSENSDPLAFWCNHQQPLSHPPSGGRELAMADMPPLVLSVALFFSSSSSISHIIILFREGLKKTLYFKVKCSLNVVVQIFAQCGCSKFLPMNVFKCSRIVGVQMFTHCGCSNVCPIWVFK